MSKIICDICGTSYPSTAECCPICGYVHDASEERMGEDLLQEDSTSQFSGRRKEIFDFDEVNSELDEEEELEDEEIEEEEAAGPNTFVVILLTILIAGLLMAAGFIFFRYFLPNMKQETPAQTAAPTEAYVETFLMETEPTVPCVNLTMSSGASAQLSAPGQSFLLHVQATPENTTDKIIYTSANENIATVTEDGRITAVAEGETIIFIACGQMTLECPVVVQYVEDTLSPETEPVVVQAEDVDPDEAPAIVDETLPPETEAPAVSANTDVTLKLKKTDIRLGVYYQFALELDCALEPTQVQWSSEHPHIATVDENGVVTAVKTGTTAIIAKYGDQEVQCIVRCI